jgi:hypothetical protein
MTNSIAQEAPRPRVDERPNGRAPRFATKRVSDRQRNLIFIGRNPLKTPDSEKKMKRNENNFAFISFHFLAFTYTNLDLKLYSYPGSFRPSQREKPVPSQRTAL